MDNNKDSLKIKAPYFEASATGWRAIVALVIIVAMLTATKALGWI